MVRRIAREIGNRKQGNDCRFQLGRPDVPVGELAVLAGDEGIKERSRDQGVDTGPPGRVLIELVFEHPFIRVNIRPEIDPFWTLPVHGSLISGKCSRRAREILHLRDFVHHLRRIASRGHGRPEFTGRGEQKRLPGGRSYVARIGADPHALARGHGARPNRVGAV